MIKNQTVTIQSRTLTVGSRGEQLYSYSTSKTVVADVQPAQLTQAQISMWGLTDLSANAKKIFLERDTSITELLRVISEGETYEIRGINHWPNHTEAILIPVQGI